METIKILVLLVTLSLTQTALAQIDHRGRIYSN